MMTTLSEREVLKGPRGSRRWGSSSFATCRGLRRPTGAATAQRNTLFPTQRRQKTLIAELTAAEVVGKISRAALAEKRTSSAASVNASAAAAVTAFAEATRLALESRTRELQEATEAAAVATGTAVTVGRRPLLLPLSDSRRSVVRAAAAARKTKATLSCRVA